MPKKNPRRSFGLDAKDFDPKSLEKGITVELEHTDDREEAKKIAMEHLTEDSWYYTKLSVVESSLFVPGAIIILTTLIYLIIKAVRQN